MEKNKIDFRKADASYIAFPSIDKWTILSVDLQKWKRYLNKIEAASSHSPEVFEHAQRIVRRYAAIETGAIEKLYSVDRGFTYTVAFELAGMEALFSKKEPNTKKIIESQLSGYDYILDLATSKDPFSESGIRQLHHVICKAQETYSVLTPHGPQERALPCGEYKTQSNHVVKADGTVHSYCPVDMVGAEMHRCIEIVRSDAFFELHPVIQSAFMHYAFVKIHPFSDGNGRVARALASVFLYRAASIPLLIMAEDREEYIDVLEAADRENYQDFVDFVLERAFAAIDLIEMSLKTGAKPPAQDSLDKLRGLYLTKGGFTHEEVDEAANELMQILNGFLSAAIGKMKESDFLTLIGFKRQSVQYQPISKDHRLFSTGAGEQFFLYISSKAPAQANVKSIITIHIPRDCGELDEFILQNEGTGEKVSARISEIIPSVKSSLEIKLEMFAESNVNELADRLFRKAKKVYRG